MEYKDTLLMPKTDFPMRGNLPVRELDIQKYWADIDIYKMMLEKRKDAKPFILHDGPPYANGNIHVGHALNKVLKDMVNRYRLMQGHYIQYITGWDTHGLPIEQAVTNSGVNRKEKTIAEFRSICHDFALTQVENQLQQFDRLGIFTDWNEKYITLLPEFEASQIKVFGKMLDEGLIYKGYKTVYWSPTSESALAEAEVEYQDIKSPSMFVAFDVTDGKGLLDNNTAIVIWTTTPWTIPANQAITIGPDFEYVVVSVVGLPKQYVIAKELLKDLAEKFEWPDYTITKTIKGTDLEGVVTNHPLFDRDSLILLGEHVTLDAGTGAVHTAPGYGEDDFAMGKKYGIELLSITDEKGVMTADAGKYEGLFYDDANKVIGQDLTEANALIKMEWMEHSYPHDWRTKKPIIYWVTNQWFASIDKIRDNVLTAIEDEVKWYMPWASTRLSNMMKTRDDWCISRQRVWGVPIPIFYTEDEQPIMDVKLVNHVADLFAKNGSNIWFERDAKDLLPVGYTHPNSPNGIFTKEEDIMDVWFDSGTSYAYVTEKYNLDYPVDLYLEGSDQYRGWFNSSLITGVATRGKAPYKAVVSAGFALDGKGRKMSKSIGNTVDPQKIIKQSGADILRLWVASVDYTSDVRISDDILKQVSESYRKMRNNFRFMLGNLFDFDAKNDAVAFNDLAEVDQYVMLMYQNYVNDTHAAYENYDFLNVYKATLQFISNTLSSFYLDYAKDILYCDGADSLRRHQVQTVIFEILHGLVRVLAPIIAHTSEEVWQDFKKVANATTDESVFETVAPESKELTAENTALLAKWSKFMTVRDDVLKALEDARNEDKVGKSLDAQVFLDLNAEYQEIIGAMEVADLQKLFMVSKVNFSKEADARACTTGNIYASAYDGEMCPRCWNRYDAEEITHDGTCTRCALVIAGLNK